MGFIKEPVGIDFIIQSEILTDLERKEISEYIKSKKEENRIANMKKIVKRKAKNIEKV
jgi:cytochrome c